MAMVFKSIKMVMNMRENGKIIKEMGKVHINTLIDPSMKDTI